jgi:outer membrane protein TolC
MDSGRFVSKRFVTWLIVGQLLTSAAAPLAASSQDEALEPQAASRTATTLLDSLEPPALQDLARDALTRNPNIARARYHAAAAASRAPQVRALPDPMAAMTLFVLPPETRVGPQVLSASLQQRFPWFGKLALREQAAIFLAAEAEAQVETARLDVLTEVRRLYYELAFLEAQATIQQTERDTLVRFERTARTRYTAGTGLQQEVVRIQAQITTAETRLLAIRERRASLLSALNTLRDRSADSEIPTPVLPDRIDDEVLSDRSPASSSSRSSAITSLTRGAIERRPEVAAIDARLAARQSLIELSERNRKPDVTLGVSYTVVDHRSDPAGRTAPPVDNGDDILALTGSVNLPVRKARLDAERAEARAARFETEEERRTLLSRITGTTGDLLARLPLLADHFRLLDTVLGIQALEALRSAETAYSTGKLNAVDLLDAEVVLLDVEIAKARTKADWNIARAQLERALASPLAVATRSVATQTSSEILSLTFEEGERP